MIRIGVAGYGYWGPRLVRNFATLPDVEIVMIVETDAARRRLAGSQYPGIAVTGDYREMLSGADIDLIVIATPLSTHFEMADLALKAGRHVLVEKPIAATSEQALRLIDTAASANKMLMVDHTFIYTEAIRRINSLIDDGTIGEVYYFDSVRVNLGLFRDTNVIYDLSVHDLSILDFVIADRPVAISATGTSHFPNQAENVAFLTLFFDRPSLIAHVHVNWLAPVKVRRTMIGGSRKMIVYDDLDPSDSVKVYDKGVEIVDDPDDISKLLVSYRTGDLWAPSLPIGEPLHAMARHAIDTLDSGGTPLTDGLSGLRILRFLEAAGASMAMKGAPIDIVWDA
jgi:predicted dehydrogenase